MGSSYLAARMLSTRLGYLRPAFFAAALALAFFAGVSGLLAPKPLGRGLSHTCFVAMSYLLDLVPTHFHLSRDRSFGHGGSAHLGILADRAQ